MSYNRWPWCSRVMVHITVPSSTYWWWWLLSNENPDGEFVMLLVDSVGVWSDEMTSNWVSELHLISRELSIGERWWAYVPELLAGVVFRFNLPLACLLFLSAVLWGGLTDEAGRVYDPLGVRWELWTGSFLPPCMLLSGLYRAGSEFVSELHKEVSFFLSRGLAEGSGLHVTGTGLIELTPLIPLIPLDMRVWLWLYALKAESLSVERMSLLLTPSLELVGDELLEKAESMLWYTCLFLTNVDGSEEAYSDWIGETTVSDSPIAESVLEKCLCLSLAMLISSSKVFSKFLMASSRTFWVSERLLLRCQTPSDSAVSDAVSALLLVNEIFRNASELRDRAPRPVSGDSRYSLYSVRCIWQGTN